MIEKISDRELNIISYFRQVAGSDAQESEFFRGKYCSNNYWLRFWKENKAWMSPVFKDSLILKKKIVSTIPLGDLMYKIQDDLLNTPCGKIVKKEILNYIVDHSDNHQLFANKDLRRDYIEVDFFSTRNLAENIYKGETFEIVPEDLNLKPIKVVKGCKLMKILGKIASYANISFEFEEFRLMHSKIMNQANIQSTLCLSIHPLDFITASVNRNDWHTCMKWNGGEYCRGVIEMMNSPCVVVAYLESEHEKLTLDNEYEWNSKKWREFFIVSESFISGIKGYPYWNKDIEATTLLWLKELFAPIFQNVKFSNNITTWAFNTLAVDKTVNAKVLFDFDCGPAMYNDFYGENSYQTILSENFQPKSCYTYFYSGQSICVVCGEESDFDSEGSLCCEDCIEHYYCCKCGDLIYRQQDLIEHNGRYYCYYCYNDLPECDFCQDTIDPDNDDDVYEFFVSNKENLNPLTSYQGKDFDDNNIRPDHWDSSGYRACGCCVNNIFKNGANEIYKQHAYYLYYYHRIPIIHTSALADCAFDFIDFDEKEDEN